MIHSINIDELLEKQETIPVADVRTPAEFDHGHIPNALNLPIFTNDERVQVGTTYKQVGREAAILLGFDLVGNKWSGFIRQALEIAPSKKIALHCWRGGMRSEAMAWALNLYGFEVYLLKGGYKSYRRKIITTFELNYPLLVLGGMTGSGKTKMLHQLRSKGEQVIDLEALAQHQGSAYGSMNRMQQPTQEQFENNLGKELLQLDHHRMIWIEDESLSIGKRFIPRPLWDQMQRAILIELKVPEDLRVEFLLKEYGCLDKDFLIEATERIHKRLGPNQTKQAVLAIREDRMEEFIRILLWYYDKTYHKVLKNSVNKNIISVELKSIDNENDLSQLLLAAKKIKMATI